MKAKRCGSSKEILHRLLRLYVAFVLPVVFGLSQTKTKAIRPNRSKGTEPSLNVQLQRCFTPSSILGDVASRLSPQVDSSGALSSLVLVRLSKQLISLDNKRNNGCDNDTAEEFLIHKNEVKSWNDGLTNAINCLVLSNWVDCEKSLEAAVEGIKAAAVISRLLPRWNPTNGNEIKDLWWAPLLEKLVEEDTHIANASQPHHLSGLKWSMDCFRLSRSHPKQLQQSLPKNLQNAYEALDLPFMIRPGFLPKITSAKKNSATNEDIETNFTVESFVEQVDFRVESIQTTSNRVVAERRQTAWQGDDHVAPFEYSGKSMKRMRWSPIVADVRNRLFKETSHYYDGCLLNLYPDGGSGMRYHIDPDQGVQWGFETVVVSIGATRRFAFRDIPSSDGDDENEVVKNSKPHMFVVMDGDVTEMVRDCQERFQHTVKTAEFKGETAPRVSLVFKKTLRSER